MDMDMHSSPSEMSGVKAAFRKPSNETGNRKYRRRSPVNGSSSSDGDVRERSSTPTPSRDNTKHDDNQLRKDDRRDIERDHRRSHYSRDGSSYRDADRASRSSYNHHRHEDYKRREKYVEEDHKNFSKSSLHSGSGTHGSHSDHSRRESEHYRSRDSVEKDARDKLDGSGHRGRDKHKRDYDSQDEKRDYQKSERSPTFKESRGPRAGHRLKESSWRDSDEINDRKYSDAQKGKYYDRETNRHKERNKDSRELLDDTSVLGRKDLESSFKKPKWGSMEKDTDHSKDDSKHGTVANEVQSSSTTQGPDFTAQMNPVQCVKESDIDAAKIAAMKAAELVNRNLIGTGYMSTDQKKKLLWGSKKTTTTEETAHRWDTSLFSDRERQEKFNKLMGVKGEAKMEQKPEINLAEKQKELQLDLEKQYTAGLRRRDGRTVGLGL